MAQNIWVRYTEQKEHAYTLDVPRDWNVEGGIVRRSAIQPHNLLVLTSPGQATKMIIGNSEAITYAIPTQMGMQMGFVEGAPYTPGGDPMMIRSYRTGQEFAVLYGQFLLQQECQNVRLVQQRDRPEAVARLAPVGGNFVQMRQTAGDAFFVCEANGHRFDAYVFSQTDLSVAGGISGIWNADNSFGFITPEGHGPAAGLVLSHIVNSLRPDQNWIANQLRTTGAEVQAAVSRANAALDQNSAAMRSTFADPSSPATSTDTQAAQAEIGRLISGFDEYTTGSGERKTVPYGAASNWWSNNQGQTAGTHSNMAPGPGYSPMNRVPPGQ